MPSRLSIIITTSVTKSNPDITVISKILKSLSSLVQNSSTDIVVVYDGIFSLNITDLGIINRAFESRFKSGRVSVEEAQRYVVFMEKSQAWIREWHSKLLRYDECVVNESGYATSEEMHALEGHSVPISLVVKKIHSPLAQYPSLTFVEASTRLGFSFAVKTALLFISTPFCLVNQHDWEFDVSGIDFDKLLDTMEQTYMHVNGKKEPLIRYVGFSASANKGFLTNQWSNRGLPGVDCTSDATLQSTKHCQTCQSRSHNTDTSDLLAQFSISSNPTPSSAHIFQFNALSFVRCHFWYDKPHITSAETYHRIFEQGLMKRGDFIEDVYGQNMVGEIKRNGLVACEAFGCWVLWDELCRLKHLNGRGFLTEEMRTVASNAGWTSRRSKKRDKRLGVTISDESIVASHSDDDFDYDDSFNVFE